VEALQGEGRFLARLRNQLQASFLNDWSGGR
jgi:hypothetical protein